MKCPHCSTKKLIQLKATTQLGYKQYKCNGCSRQFNERTGTDFNYIEWPNEVVMLALYHYYRFKLSLDDVVDLLSLRSIEVSHQTIHNWVHTFGPQLGLSMRKKRQGKNNLKWNIDAIYIKVHGHWYYLYRAIDKNGDLVDVYLNETRDATAATKFLRQAKQTSGVSPSQITTDKELALYPAIKNVFNNKTKHRDSKYMNNIIEADHRGIKSRWKVMKNFKNPFCALIFCTVFEEIRQLLSSKNETRSQSRKIMPSKFQAFNNHFRMTA
jgi:transposase-like protein